MSDRIEVDRAALREVLEALIGPPHLIRELQVISSIPGSNNPVSKLIQDYNRDLASRGYQRLSSNGA